MKFLAALLPLLRGLFTKILGKLLTMLGISVVVYTGLEKIINMFKQQIIHNITIVPENLLQLFYLAGGGAALNILFGGFAFWLSIQAVNRITTSLGKK